MPQRTHSLKSGFYVHPVLIYIPIHAFCHTCSTSSRPWHPPIHCEHQRICSLHVIRGRDYGSTERNHSFVVLEAGGTQGVIVPLIVIPPEPSLRPEEQQQLKASHLLHDHLLPSPCGVKDTLRATRKCRETERVAERKKERYCVTSLRPDQ